MHSAAALIAIFMGIFISCFIPFVLMGKTWPAEQEKAHRRRLADAKMNARLLRFNL
jgi:hypothetical protein